MGRLPKARRGRAGRTRQAPGKDPQLSSSCGPGRTRQRRGWSASFQTSLVVVPPPGKQPSPAASQPDLRPAPPHSPGEAGLLDYFSARCVSGRRGGAPCELASEAMITDSFIAIENGGGGGREIGSLTTGSICAFLACSRAPSESQFSLERGTRLGGGGGAESETGKLTRPKGRAQKEEAPP